LFVEKVEKGLQDMAEGKLIPLQEAKQRFLNKWEKQK
jgi:predicted transcriptional regulator